MTHSGFGQNCIINGIRVETVKKRIDRVIQFGNFWFSRMFGRQELKVIRAIPGAMIRVERSEDESAKALCAHRECFQRAIKKRLIEKLQFIRKNPFRVVSRTNAAAIFPFKDMPSFFEYLCSTERKQVLLPDLKSALDDGHLFSYVKLKI